MLRDTAGLSQGQPAEAMSVSRQTINSIETGATRRRCPWRWLWHGSSTARWRRSFMETKMHRVFRSRWWMPAFSVALGVAILVAAWAGGDLAFGLFGFGLMTALGAVFLLGGPTAATSDGRRSTGVPRPVPAWC
jgi:hypothetical protein